MALSLLNGLSQMGRGVSDYAGAVGLEAQKAGLARDSMMLADQLQTGRDTRQNTFAAGENVLNRESSAKVANIGADASRYSSDQAAGASRYSSDAHAQASRDVANIQTNATPPEIRSAKDFALLNPDEKRAYREQMMTKAGLPPWMIGDDTAGGPVASSTNTSAPVTGDGTSPTPSRSGLNEDALKRLPAPAVSLVKGMVDGRISPPSSFAASKPYWQNLIQMATTYDPTFDETSWSGRVATRKDFAAGQSAKAVTALNTALGHAGDLMGNFEKLGNFGGVGTVFNAPLNWLEQKTGDPRQTIVEQNINALASEARKVFAAAGGGNLTELQEWQKSFPMNGSPEQQRGALKGFVSLLDSRLQALADQYNRGMGKTDDPVSLLQPKARAVYEKLTGHESTGSTGYQDGKAPASDTKAAPVIAPADPAARELNKSYPLPNGKTGIWRGTGWELAP